MSEAQRLEHLAERLRSIEPSRPSPAAKIRGWNLVIAQVQAPTSRRSQARSTARLVLAGLAAAALLVAGAVAAAADSLPDSALYPIKGTIERVEGAFAFSPADQFNYHLSLARTRLREAEAMFARHRVDLADDALAALDEQLNGAALAVQTAKAADPAAGADLERQLQQAVETHDNQLAGLQGQVTNPTAVTAIANARDRAQQALQVAAAPVDNGQGSPKSSPSAKPHSQGSPATPSKSPRPTRP
jgi:hypothetical protein